MGKRHKIQIWKEKIKSNNTIQTCLNLTILKSVTVPYYNPLVNQFIVIQLTIKMKKWLGNNQWCAPWHHQHAPLSQVLMYSIRYLCLDFIIPGIRIYTLAWNQNQSWLLVKEHWSSLIWKKRHGIRDIFWHLILDES